MLVRVWLHVGEDYCHKFIGANRPGTVPDLEALSLVPPGKCYLPEMSRIFKVAAPELG